MGFLESWVCGELQLYYKKPYLLIFWRRYWFRQPESGFSARFKGKYLYLDRNEYHRPSPIYRLQFNGQMNNWGFAIYKYSDNGYDPKNGFSQGLGKLMALLKEP